MSRGVYVAPYPGTRREAVHGVWVPGNVFIPRATAFELLMAAMHNSGDVLDADRQDAQAMATAGWAQRCGGGYMPTQVFIDHVWPEIEKLPRA